MCRRDFHIGGVAVNDVVPSCSVRLDSGRSFRSAAASQRDGTRKPHVCMCMFRRTKCARVYSFVMSCEHIIIICVLLLRHPTPRKLNVRCSTLDMCWPLMCACVLLNNVQCETYSNTCTHTHTLALVVPGPAVEPHGTRKTEPSGAHTKFRVEC